MFDSYKNSRTECKIVYHKGNKMYNIQSSILTSIQNTTSL
jgi:hypothetical protein